MMFKKSFLTSDFSRNTLILVIGSIFAQVIPFCVHPFLRRIYTAEDFGAMAIYLNIFAVLTIISSLRYDTAILLPKSDVESANILSLTFIITLFFNSLVLLILLFFKKKICVLINFPEAYSNYLYCLPVVGFFFGINQAMNYWLVRKKAFRASTFNKITRRIIEAGGHTSLGFLKFPGGLFVGDLLGNIANTISSFNQLFKSSFNSKYITLRKVKFVLLKYKEYPLYNMLPTLLSSIANVLPFLFINKFYSTEIVGYLDLSKLILSIPLVFVSATISQVFFQKITEKKHQSLSIKQDVINILWVLLVIIVIEFVLILILGPTLFGWVFGDKYQLSGYFSQILIYSFVLNFIGSTFSSVFIAFGKIKMNALWQMSYFIAICSLVFFKDIGIYEFLKVYVGVEIVMHLAYCFMIYHVMKKYENALVI